ncbi:hypothetical protein QWA68_012291, partial [Fusarium oxysporum]
RLNAQDPPREIRLCRARMVPRAVQRHVERMGTRASVPEVRYSSLSKYLGPWDRLTCCKRGRLALQVDGNRDIAKSTWDSRY